MEMAWTHWEDVCKRPNRADLPSGPRSARHSFTQVHTSAGADKQRSAVFWNFHGLL